MYPLNTLNHAKNPLCPWCGRVVPENQASVEHVVPRSFWKAVYDDFGWWGGSTVNDVCNRMVAHIRCNQIRGASLAVPNWRMSGRFCYWEKGALRCYATYFYKWSYVFIAHIYNGESILIDREIPRILEFQREFERRQVEEDWEFTL